VESCKSGNFFLTSNLFFKKEARDYSCKPGEIFGGVFFPDGRQQIICNDEASGRLRTMKLYRRGNYIYRMPEYEFLKSMILVITLPLHNLLIKILFPLLVYKPLVFCTSHLRAKQVLKKISLINPIMNPKSLNPVRAICAMVGHVAIGILGLIPPFSNFFNKLNGDLERWVNGCSIQDVKEKSYGRRIREGFFIAPCQQPLFYLVSKGNLISYSDMQNADRDLVILKGFARELKLKSNRKNIRMGETTIF
jgi:hypothetical protein